MVTRWELHYSSLCQTALSPQFAQAFQAGIVAQFRSWQLVTYAAIYKTGFSRIASQFGRGSEKSL